MQDGAGLAAADWIMESKAGRDDVRISASFEKGQVVDVFRAFDGVALVRSDLGSSKLPVER